MLTMIAGRLVIGLPVCIYSCAIHDSQRSNRGYGSLLRSFATSGVRSYLGHGL
jgi:hypothetical protein